MYLLCFYSNGKKDKSQYTKLIKFQNKKEKKYDVTIKVKNNFGSEWIFTPDIQELSVEYEYTGTPIRFYINKLCVLNSERAEPDWIWVDQIQDYEFYRNVSYTPLNGVESNAKSGAVCERGEYLIRYDFHGPEFYYDRTFVLRVTIK